MLTVKKISRLFKLCVAALCLAVSLCVSSAYAADDKVYLGGFPAGFMLNTQTVEVVGVCDVLCDGGLKSPARDAGIRSGDVIDEVNGMEINSTEDLNEVLEEKYSSFTLTVIRDGEETSIGVTPVKEKSSGKTRLGLLVKDSISGVGTVTYVEKSGAFGSLGHPVTNSDGKITAINGGCIYGCTIYGVKRGVRGTPGELKGAFDDTAIIGKVSVNSSGGISGTLSEDFDYSRLTEIKRGRVSDATIGKATIYSTLSGTEPAEYEVSIVKVDPTEKNNRNYVIKIDDENLIEKSGGIVQGMSGSPIVQNGKLIGAVTHVFVNDPTRGYGIAIDKMTSSY